MTMRKSSFEKVRGCETCKHSSSCSAWCHHVELFHVVQVFSVTCEQKFFRKTGRVIYTVKPKFTHTHLTYLDLKDRDLGNKNVI